VRAKALLASGKHDELAAELDHCQRLLPGDVRWIVDMVPKLDRAGLTAVAEKLFEQSFAAQQRVCEEFPNSATYFNNAAWICARSQRKLDEALALVEKAP